jgi:hypothetical protein
MTASTSKDIQWALLLQISREEHTLRDRFLLASLTPTAPAIDSIPSLAVNLFPYRRTAIDYQADIR